MSFIVSCTSSISQVFLSIAASSHCNVIVPGSRWYSPPLSFIAALLIYSTYIRVPWTSLKFPSGLKTAVAPGATGSGLLAPPPTTFASFRSKADAVWMVESGIPGVLALNSSLCVCSPSALAVGGGWHK